MACVQLVLPALRKRMMQDEGVSGTSFRHISRYLDGKICETIDGDRLQWYAFVHGHVGDREQGLGLGNVFVVFRPELGFYRFYTVHDTQRIPSRHVSGARPVPSNYKGICHVATCGTRHLWFSGPGEPGGRRQLGKVGGWRRDQ
jgi:hypothetical protein